MLDDIIFPVVECDFIDFTHKTNYFTYLHGEEKFCSPLISKFRPTEKLYFVSCSNK